MVGNKPNTANYLGLCFLCLFGFFVVVFFNFIFLFCFGVLWVFLLVVIFGFCFLVFFLVFLHGLQNMPKTASAGIRNTIAFRWSLVTLGSLCLSLLW